MPDADDEAWQEALDDALGALIAELCREVRARVARDSEDYLNLSTTGSLIGFNV